MEIMQLSIDKEGIPIDLNSSAGRFIAESTTFHDSALYSPNSLITLVGEVKGKRAQPLDGAPYLYPVLAIKEIYLWDPDKFGGRRFSQPANPYANTYDQPMPDRPLTPPIIRR
jgi:outer membrane lipoprotein